MRDLSGYVPQFQQQGSDRVRHSRRLGSQDSITFDVDSSDLDSSGEFRRVPDVDLVEKDGVRAGDAVVDTSGHLPRAVKAAAEVLADEVERYVFISTQYVDRR